MSIACVAVIGKEVGWATVRCSADARSHAARASVKLCNSHSSMHRCRCGCSHCDLFTTPLVQNDPLYLRTFTSNNPSSASSPSSVPFASSSLNPAAAGPLNWNNDQGLKFHYFVHTSLDAIEEKSTNHTHAHRRFRWAGSEFG